MACYAATLGGCSTKMTREHYVSRTVLERLFKLGGLKVSNTPWPMPATGVGPNALASRILCSVHNPLLSELDDEAGRFFGLICDVPESLRGAGAVPTVVEVSGDRLERWLLKVLCGAVSAGLLRDPSGRAMSFASTPLAWLRLLFGHDRFARGQGLYLSMPHGDSASAEPCVSFVPLCAPLSGRDAAVGCTITLAGLRFTLAMWHVHDSGTPPMPGALFRPPFIRFLSGERSLHVPIRWADGWRGMGVEVKWSPLADVSERGV